jgi:hypothetical protein
MSSSARPGLRPRRIKTPASTTLAWPDGDAVTELEILLDSFGSAAYPGAMMVRVDSFVAPMLFSTKVHSELRNEAFVLATTEPTEYKPQTLSEAERTWKAFLLVHGVVNGALEFAKTAITRSWLHMDEGWEESVIIACMQQYVRNPKCLLCAHVVQVCRSVSPHARSPFQYQDYEGSLCCRLPSCWRPGDRGHSRRNSARHLCHQSLGRCTMGFRRCSR